MNVFELMLAPFVECLVLVGIHSYLGLHVIRRRIIFVDLALAQIAALGTTVGYLFGIQPGTTGCFIFALTFCVLGAAVFSMTRMRRDHVPQEAVIGLVYAITAALAILVVQKTKGAEHLEDLLVGSLLWVKWSDIAYAAVAYAVIGVLHYLFRRQFLLISDDPDEAFRRGMAVRLWDFLFYATFGLVIAISVRVAGVLLVFVFLVAPAILAVMVTKRFGAQLLVGWIAGTVVTVVGLYLSYVLDLSSGPAVIGLYGVALALAAVVVSIARSPKKKAALTRAALGVVATAAVAGALVIEGRMLARGVHRDAQAASQHDIHSGFPSHDRPDSSATPRANGDQRDVASDPEEMIRTIRIRQKKGEGKGAALLLRLLENPDVPPFYREEAAELLREMAGRDFGYRPDLDPARNKAAMDSIRDWVKRRVPSGEGLAY
jgi:zinc/manganese transport system permease protein